MRGSLPSISCDKNKELVDNCKIIERNFLSRRVPPILENPVSHRFFNRVNRNYPITNIHQILEPRLFHIHGSNDENFNNLLLLQMNLCRLQSTESNHYLGDLDIMRITSSFVIMNSHVNNNSNIDLGIQFSTPPLLIRSIDRQLIERDGSEQLSPSFVNPNVLLSNGNRQNVHDELDHMPIDSIIAESVSNSNINYIPEQSELEFIPMQRALSINPNSSINSIFQADNNCISPIQQDDTFSQL